MKPAIVVLAFNRPIAFSRLLDSLAAAEYQVTPLLIISLDGGASAEVVAIAESFSSTKLRVKVLRREIQQGLRDHVITCGDLTAKYGSVVILEDDLLVDRYFYNYSSQALDFYANEDEVVGIALYSHEYNEFCGLPFQPMHNGFSTYFMQVPCSWGQCWSKKQWDRFKAWYIGKTPADLEQIEGLPESVRSWPESSWKKYFHGYIVETKKYFVYPYTSFTTNCSDEGGTHITRQSNIHQVCLPSPKRPEPTLFFCPTWDKEIVYDAFQEPTGDFVYRALGMTADEVAIDIQGKKPILLLRKRKYVVTPRKTKKKLASFRYDFRPPELNLLFPVKENKAHFSLSLTTSLNDKNNACLLLSRFNYYAKMELMNKHIFFALLLAFPSMMASRIYSLLKFK